MHRIVMTCLLILGAGASSAKTLYVKPGGPGPSPYDSWATAAATLQDAVDAAAPDDTILVAPGTYSEPASETNVVHIPGSTLIPGNSTLTLRAAFPPGVTTGAPVIDGQDVNRGILLDTADTVDVWNPRTLIIDGFHIINGNAGTGQGGAISITGHVLRMLHVELLNTTITNNVAERGGGLYMAHGVRPFFTTISNCVIRFNHATSADRGGGGIYLENDSTLGPADWSILNSEISDNTADFAGGGMYVYLFRDGTFQVKNSLFANNSAADGSAYYHRGLSGSLKETKDIEFWNSTIVTNQATTANGAIYFRYAGGSFAGYNLIFNQNQNADIQERNVTGGVTPLTIEYSRIDTADTNVFPAPSNTTDPPRFENAEAGDFRLSLSSPCLQNGTNAAWMATATDLDGNPRQDATHGLVDMGCYERVFHGTVISIQ